MEMEIKSLIPIIAKTAPRKESAGEGASKERDSGWKDGQLLHET